MAGFCGVSACQRLPGCFPSVRAGWVRGSALCRWNLEGFVVASAAALADRQMEGGLLNAAGRGAASAERRRICHGKMGCRLSVMRCRAVPCRAVCYACARARLQSRPSAVAGTACADGKGVRALGRAG
jgi:hypothetical protein